MYEEGRCGFQVMTRLAPHAEVIDEGRWMETGRRVEGQVRSTSGQAR